MTKRYVLVKGRFGLGGRIAVMLSAYRYAVDTDRELVVDWNDFSYYSPGIVDVFSNLFDWPKACALTTVDVEAATVFPEVWQEKLGLYRDAVDAEVMPYDLSFAAPPSLRQEIAEDVVVITRNDKQSRYRRFYSQLIPHEKVRALIDAHRSQFAFDSAIGVQIRHGNGERYLVPPDTTWFHERIAALRAQDPQRGIFLATDSPEIVAEFIARYENLYHTSKWYPPAGSGSMHQHASCVDRFQNAVEALVDIFLLARCPSLVICSGFFGKTAWLIGGRDKTHVEIFPDKIHPSKEDKADWDNPI